MLEPAGSPEVAIVSTELVLVVLPGALVLDDRSTLEEVAKLEVVCKELVPEVVA